MVFPVIFPSNPLKESPDVTVLDPRCEPLILQIVQEELLHGVATGTHSQNFRPKRTANNTVVRNDDRFFLPKIEMYLYIYYT